MKLTRAIMLTGVMMAATNGGALARQDERLGKLSIPTS